MLCMPCFCAPQPNDASPVRLLWDPRSSTQCSGSAVPVQEALQMRAPRSVPPFSLRTKGPSCAWGRDMHAMARVHVPWVWVVEFQLVHQWDKSFQPKVLVRSCKLWGLVLVPLIQSLGKSYLLSQTQAQTQALKAWKRRYSYESLGQKIHPPRSADIPSKPRTGATRLLCKASESWSGLLSSSIVTRKNMTQSQTHEDWTANYFVLKLFNSQVW
jgi:hypothetical protein